MTSESDRHPVLFVVAGNGDVAVVDGLFRAAQVDVEIRDNRRAMTVQPMPTCRSNALKSSTQLHVYS